MRDDDGDKHPASGGSSGESKGAVMTESGPAQPDRQDAHSARNSLNTAKDATKTTGGYHSEGVPCEEPDAVTTGDDDLPATGDEKSGSSHDLGDDSTASSERPDCVARPAAESTACGDSDVSAKASVGVAAGNGKAHKKPEGILRHVSGTKGATDYTVLTTSTMKGLFRVRTKVIEPVPEPGERDVSEAGSRAGSDDSVAERAEHPDNSYITGGAPKRIFNADGKGDGAVGSKDQIVQGIRHKGKRKRGGSKEVAAGKQQKGEPKRKRTASQAGVDPSGKKKLRLYSPHVADRSTSSCEEEAKVASHEDDEKEASHEGDEKGVSQEDEEKGASHEDSDGEGLPIYLQFLEEKKPRERASKTTPEREAMIAAHVNVNNHMNPIQRKGFQHGSRGCLSLKSIALVTTSSFASARPKLSRSTTLRKHFTSISQRIAARKEYIKNGGGKRNASVNFTGCPARFDLELMNVAPPGKPPRHRLIVYNEWRMHNHTTEISGATVGVKELPTQGVVAQTVSALHDCNASSGKIAGSMSEELGRTITSQVARKFIRKLQGGSAAQSRLKLLLDSLAAEEDCEAMVIHDQMGVTCAIVVQSATQKLAFKNWGETLAMDWTHGTNNVGYHLGRLVATMPTGRGFPVLDFMSLNEKAVTLENFF
ncbi:hypothetical protein L914_08837 [Phytophthora nicotianae]|uniref:ZSWIM1/3 RNaseH-like domain-containing protein n=1 Tax=Phytophthora nicotianae TaxID=4792 RepID=W2NC39_PHYNI|nr:hypothetical protein L914_08837 [Phytophthora nicotianae]